MSRPRQPHLRLRVCWGSGLSDREPISEKFSCCPVQCYRTNGRGTTHLRPPDKLSRIVKLALTPPWTWARQYNVKNLGSIGWWLVQDWSNSIKLLLWMGINSINNLPMQRPWPEIFTEAQTYSFCLKGTFLIILANIMIFGDVFYICNIERDCQHLEETHEFFSTTFPVG